MANDSFKIRKSLNIEPVTGSTVTAEGDVAYNDTSNQLELHNGSTSESVTTASNTQTLTGKTIDADGSGNTITNLENENIKAAAAIALNKLAATTASRALVSDGSGFVSAATTTATEIGYVNGVTSSIQTQLNNLVTGNASDQITNLGLSASVAANALTIALKQADGSTNPSSGTSAVGIGFRNATSATGGFSIVQATGAVSVVISSGSTLGHASAVNQYIYVYAINNAGTIELAVSGSHLFDDGSVVTTTAEGGVGAADSLTTIYSTTARSGVACRLIGRIQSNQTVAGTWASAVTEIALKTSFQDKQQRSKVTVNTPNGHGSTNNKIRIYTNTKQSTGSAITYATSAANGDSFTINENGLYIISMTDKYNAGTAEVGISVNSSQLTTGISGITDANRIAWNHTSGTDFFGSVTGFAILQAGDVIRAHSDGQLNNTGAVAEFSIMKVSN